MDQDYLIISDGSGEAVNEEEAHGGGFQSDIQETGVLSSYSEQSIVVQREHNLKRKSLPCKYSLNWLQRHVGGSQ